MSLEDRINSFAEEARRILIEELAKKADTEVVTNKGFNEDGKHTIKNLDQITTTRGLGQKYVPKNSKLILDNTGSVERRKSSGGIDFSRSKKPKEPIVIKAGDINREAITFLEDGSFSEEPLNEIVPGWVMLYFGSNYVSEVTPLGRNWGSASSYLDWDGTYYSSSRTGQNGARVTHGKCYRIAWSYVYCSTQSIGNDLHSVSGSATAGGTSASVSFTSPLNSYNYNNYDYEEEIVETDADIDCTSQATADTTWLGDPIGEVIAVGQYRYLQFPNAKIYIESTPDESGNTTVITLDLNDYVDYDVFRFNLARCYGKAEITSQIEGEDIQYNVVVYHSYSVLHVDMSDGTYEAVNVGSAPYQTAYTSHVRRQGRMYNGIVNLKTNLTTGLTQSNYTLIDDYSWSNYKYILYWSYFSDSNGSSGFPWMSPIATTSTAYYHTDPEPLWKNSFEGDWIHAFKDIGGITASITERELDDFLRISYTDPLWESGQHKLAPRSLTGGSSEGYQYDPALYGNKWAGGQPDYNSYEDIENLGVVCTNVSYLWGTIRVDIPGLDEFVEIDQYANSFLLTGHIYLPNTPTGITNTETLLGDRLYTSAICNVPDPNGVEEEGSGYP